METLEKKAEECSTAFVTVKEAAAITCLSKSKVYQLIEQGILRRVRLPGCAKVLISEDELRRYIREGIEAGCASTSA